MECRSRTPYEEMMYTDQPSMNTCILCGSEFGTINFKNKCVCEECLIFVKEFM